MADLEGFGLRFLFEASAKVQQVDKAGSALNRLSASLRDLEFRFRLAGRTLLAFSGAVGGLAAVAGVSFARFESELLNVRKTTNSTIPQMQELGSEILELSKTIPTSANELARLAAIGGQLGLAVEDIGEFTKVAAQMGLATRVSAEEAAVALGKLDAIFELQGKGFNRIGSIINSLENTTVAFADQLVKVGLRIGPLSKQLGLAADQMFGFAAAAIETGATTQRAGTAVNKLMAQVLLKLPEAARIAGKSSTDFADTLKRKPVEALISFLDGLNALADPAKVVQAFTSMGLAGERVAPTLLKLASNTKRIRDNMAVANAQMLNATSLQREADIQTSGLASKFELLKNSVQAATIEAIQPFALILKPIVTGLQTLVDLFAATPGPIKFAVISVALLAAGAAALLGTAAFLAATLATLTVIVIQLGKSWDSVRKFLAFFNTEELKATFQTGSFSAVIGSLIPTLKVLSTQIKDLVANELALAAATSTTTTAMQTKTTAINQQIAAMDALAVNSIATQEAFAATDAAAIAASTSFVGLETDLDRARFATSELGRQLLSTTGDLVGVGLTAEAFKTEQINRAFGALALRLQTVEQVGIKVEEGLKGVALQADRLRAIRESTARLGAFSKEARQFPATIKPLTGGFAELEQALTALNATSNVTSILPTLPEAPRVISLPATSIEELTTQAVRDAEQAFARRARQRIPTVLGDVKKGLSAVGRTAKTAGKSIQKGLAPVGRFVQKGLAPVGRLATKVFTPVGNAIGSVTRTAVTEVGAMAGFISANLAGLASGVGIVISAFSVWNSLMDSSNRALNALGVAFLFWLGPTTAVFFAIGRLMRGIFQPFIEVVREAASVVGMLGSAFVDGLMFPVNLLSGLFQTVVKKVFIDPLVALRNTLKSVADSPAFKTIISTIKDIGAALTVLTISTALPSFIGGVVSIFGVLKGLALFIFEAFISPILDAGAAIIKMVGEAIAPFKEMFGAIGGGTTFIDALTTSINVLAGTFRVVGFVIGLSIRVFLFPLRATIRIITAAIKGLGLLLQFLGTTAIPAIFAAFKTNFPTLTKVIQFVITLFTKIVDAVRSAVSWVQRLIQKFQGLFDAARSVKEFLFGSSFLHLKEGIAEVTPAIRGALTASFSGLRREVRAVSDELRASPIPINATRAARTPTTTSTVVQAAAPSTGPLEVTVPVTLMLPDGSVLAREVVKTQVDRARRSFAPLSFGRGNLPTEGV